VNVPTDHLFREFLIEGVGYINEFIVVRCPSLSDCNIQNKTHNLYKYWRANFVFIMRGFKGKALGWPGDACCVGNYADDCAQTI
jgi:hypothetical protein